ncbi:MAG: hypothetical protein HKP31_00025 [Nitrosopumilus sp.]|nr:hypothetical protein [Nitrosopumilus sp.]
MEKPSITDTMEKHTMELVKKFESQVPLHIKSFSDFSREYLKLLEQSFKINCSVEKKILSKMSVDEKTIKLLDDYLEGSSKFYSSQIDMATEFFKGYLTMRLSMMELYNKFVLDFANQIKPEKISTESEPI